MADIINPARFVVFGDGEVGYRITRYSREMPHLKQVGYVETEPSILRDVANELRVPLYAANRDSYDKLHKAGNKPVGTLDDLSDVEFDVAIDATEPQVYFLDKVPNFRLDVPIIGQGSLTEGFDISVSSLVNLRLVPGRKRIRKVSCNTTAASRVISKLQETYGLGTNADGENYEISLYRRTANFGLKGLVDNVSFGTGPKTQHHAHDIDLVFLDLSKSDGGDESTRGKSLAYQGSHTRGHVQHIQIYLNSRPKEGHELEDIYSLLEQSPRMRLLSGVDDIAKVINYFLRKGRFMGDFPENVIIKESIQYNPRSNSVELTQLVDNVSIVIPENLDIMLMLNGNSKSPGEIIKKVDQNLDDRLLPGFLNPNAKYMGPDDFENSSKSFVQTQI